MVFLEEMNDVFMGLPLLIEKCIPTREVNSLSIPVLHVGPGDNVSNGTTQIW
jgi:hypothetical protein